MKLLLLAFGLACLCIENVAAGWLGNQTLLAGPVVNLLGTLA